MDGSYLLNTNTQNIVQCAAAQRAVTHRRCTKNDTNRRTAICSFYRTVIRHELPTRVFNVKAGVPVRSSISAVTTALILLLGIGVAEAANPMLLAETGGFLLANAHRCGVAVERVERVGK